MKGTCVGVYDGCTLIIKYVDQKNKIEAVKLDAIKAPKLASIYGNKLERPWAWESFDYLRRLAIAKKVVVIPATRFDNKGMNKFSNHFGNLKVNFGRVELFDKDGMDIGMACVDAGWCSVVENQSDDDYRYQLSQLQYQAKQAKRGIWQEGDGHVRDIPVKFEPEKLIKQRDFDAVVDSIPLGSTFHLWLLPRFEYVTVQLAGIKCPQAKKRALEPFGKEAKLFVEQRLLQRTVKVSILDVLDKVQSPVFIGNVIHPHGGDIAPLLLREGLGEIFNPTMHLVPIGEDYRGAELAGMHARKNKWRNIDLVTLKSTTFKGRVFEVKGSSCVCIKINENKVKYVHLSSIKLPIYIPGKRVEPLGFEAHEFLRRFTIGKEARVIIDYKMDMRDGESRDCATIYVDEDKCVNEEMVRNGFASVWFPRGVRPSEKVDSMSRIENTNKEKKIGIFADVLPTPASFNDLSKKMTKETSLPLLNLIVNKPQSAVIEYFVNPTKCVVFLGAQNTLIRMNLMGIIGIDVEERLGANALEYVRDNYMQRDCEVVLKEIDRIGVFIGTVTTPGIKPRSLEVDLVSRGMADIHPSFSRHPRRDELTAAIADAKAKKIGMWNDQNTQLLELELGNIYEVNVTAVWDPVTVVIQLQSDDLAKINQTLVQARYPVDKVLKGDLVAAIFERKIYRGRVVQVMGQIAKVDFIELCVLDTVRISDLRKLPDELKSIPPQAIVVKIGGCRRFGLDKSFDAAVEDFVWGLVEGKTLYAHLMLDDGKHDPEVLLTDRPSLDGGSVNTMLLAKGYARLHYMELVEPMGTVMRRLDQVEYAARMAHVGAWKDVNIEEEDESIENGY